MIRLFDVKPVVEILGKFGAGAFLEDEECDIGLIYREELKLVKTRQTFENHVNRWRNLFHLESQTTGSLERHITGRFNVDLVYDKWKRIDNGLHTSGYKGFGEYYVMAACITLPSPILQSFLISKKYEVSPNVVLIQLYNGRGGEFF
jgi:hypothetical protein